MTTLGNLQPVSSNVPQRHRHLIKCIQPIIHHRQWKHLDAVINSDEKGYHEYGWKSVDESYILQFLCPSHLLQPLCTAIQQSNSELQIVQLASRFFWVYTTKRLQ
ncbi:hypothetical protein SUGI_1189300 [Cryptomeria japonica]|nr:hypothetical protein SUGI_1189300 [Cryptomeria japonica]